MRAHCYRQYPLHRQVSDRCAYAAPCKCVASDFQQKQGPVFSLAVMDRPAPWGPQGSLTRQGLEPGPHMPMLPIAHVACRCVNLIAGGTGITPCWQIITAITANAADSTKLCSAVLGVSTMHKCCQKSLCVRLSVSGCPATGFRAFELQSFTSGLQCHC